MRILFYHPTASSTDPEPTIGLGLLIAIARERGHEVEFYDHDKDCIKIVFEKVVADFKPDIFAVSCMTPQYFYAQKIIKYVKELLPNCITIIGGPHASALPVETMEEMQELDYLCNGEGEGTFAEFLDSIDKNDESNFSIDGLYYKKDGRSVIPRRRELMSSHELNLLPMAAWDVLLRNGLYGQTLNYTGKRVNVFSVITARGCPFECTFCDERSIWKRRVRERSIDNVIEEIRFLVSNYGAEHFNILDDTFTLKHERVSDFCKKVKKLNISYRITAKVNTVTQEMLDELADSGCKLVAYGVESGDENVLKIMKKRQKLETVRKVFEMTNRAEMMSYALCMVGNIGEDFEAVKKTAQFVRDINATLFSAAIMTPYPGSENYQICVRNGWILTKNWEKWCPSPIRLKDWEPVSMTDKMDRSLMLKSYYYLNRVFMFIRFKRKYGSLYFLNHNFYISEIFNRIKYIGYSGFFKHIYQLLKVTVEKRV